MLVDADAVDGRCLHRSLARFLAVVVKDLRQMSEGRNDDLERGH